MKKLLALVALALGVVSCQTESDGIDVTLCDEVDAFVSVSIPETRSNSALGAFDNVDFTTYSIRYILDVYYDQERVDRLVNYADTSTTSFVVRLAPGRPYKFVVWADVVEGEGDLHYNTSDLANVTLNGDWEAMDETRDAFTGFVDVANYDRLSNIGITLTRPFAKLRVVATDLADLAKLGITPAKATVEYTTAHRASFNALTGLSGDATIAAGKTHTFDIAAYDDEGVLLTDYFFASDDVVKFNMAVMESDGTPIQSNEFTTDVFVKRNHLTTIKGRILTDANSLSVVVEDAFGGQLDNNVDTGELVVTVNNTADFVAAVANQNVDIIVLNDDITLNSLLTRAESDVTLLVASGKTLTIDLNGKRLSAVSTQTGKNYNMFDVRGTLTLKNGRMEYEHNGENMGWNNSTNLFNITAGGVVNLEGVTATNFGGSDMAFVAHLNNWGKATLNVTDCTLESSYIAVRVFNSGYDMNNVTISESVLKGRYCFWVHNYQAAGDAVGTDATLNLDIFNGTNTFEYTGKAPVLYGFANPIYFDANGDVVVVAAE